MKDRLLTQMTIRDTPVWEMWEIFPMTPAVVMVGDKPVEGVVSVEGVVERWWLLLVINLPIRARSHRTLSQKIESILKMFKSGEVRLPKGVSLADRARTSGLLRT